MLRKIRKWFLCWKYGICPVHGELMHRGGYNEPRWWCQSCRTENQGRNLHREHTDQLARVRAQEQLNRDWKSEASR